MKRLWLILATMLGLAGSAMPASAAIQYTLNCSGNAANCGVGNNNFNFGTVTLSDNGGGSVDVTVELASGYQFGDNNSQSFYWNTTASGDQTLSNLTGGFGSNGTQSNSSYTAGSYFNTGDFDFRVQRSNNSGSPTSLSFDVTRTGGLTLADFATGNDGGVFYFAAQIRTTASSTLFWVASNKAGVDIPEPATWLLFFSVLVGLTMFYRRRQPVRA